MIIGHGDIASVLSDRTDWIYFASGVSNSQEKRESQYQREIDLLMRQDKDKHLVYFSSLCIFYTNNRYAKHKRHMEDLTKKTFKHYTILRLGNITWGNNPHTLINHFKNQIKNKEKLKIRDAYRYLIDKDEFFHWMNMIPNWNCEMNLTGKRLKVDQIVKKIKLGTI